jgi:hypothetical protein
MYTKSKKIFLSFLNLIGFLAIVIVNSLAVMLPINNRTTEELSDKYPNLFVPAGLTFSIWGIIYILLAFFIVYQLIAAFKEKIGERGLFEKIGVIFFISAVLNVGWILAWHYEIVWLSLVIMLMLLASLLAIYIRLKIGKSDARVSEKVFGHIPFSVYLGWITIATIANVTALLVKVGWGRFGLSEQFWTVLVITVGIFIALAMLFIRNDIFYCLVVDWAFIGILIKRLSDKTASALPVIITIIVGLSVITIGIIIQKIRSRSLY